MKIRDVILGCFNLAVYLKDRGPGTRKNNPRMAFGLLCNVPLRCENAREGGKKSTFAHSTKLTPLYTP